MRTCTDLEEGQFEARGHTTVSSLEPLEPNDGSIEAENVQVGLDLIEVAFDAEHQRDRKSVV